MEWSSSSKAWPFTRERTLTVLQVGLYHPTLGPAAFTNVPVWQCDTSPLLVGWGQDAHLQLQLPQLSHENLSLEPYLEKGSTLSTFCIKVLSDKSCVINWLTLRYLEQVPQNTVSRASFCDVQMVVHMEGGTSLEAFVCCFHRSPSLQIYQPKAEESDEWEALQERSPPGSGTQTAGHLQFLHSSS
ncbi:LOW QUALITY PROTEIN: TRAF-interacting protein with FHA domain-containing protein B [Erethizon dorsatum]